VLFRVENVIVSEAEWAIELGRFIKDNVEEETGISVSIGIGRRYKDILDLHLSYKDAITACHHKFFLGKSQIIHIENVIPFSEELSLFSIEVESQLSVKVMSCDEEGAFSIVDELFSNAVQERSVNPLIMKTRLIEIITTLIKIAFEAGADQEKLAALSGRLVEEILRSDTISELRSQMREVLRGIIEEVSLGRKRMNLQVFEKAVSYIHENFRRPITLEEVAEHVYISSYYFSRHFKNFTGMNFIDYLTKVRIEEAKKLLLTTDLNISQISRQVGYHDPSYFGRVFKKVVGMPPSKFKVNKKVHIDRIFSEG
jgi:two-component system response regulator YesN